MLRLIDDVFTTRHDPDQLQVTPAEQQKLAAIHPAALSERADEKGPYCWVLMIPTTEQLMLDFVEGKLSETTLLEKTCPGDQYRAIYLCSATTLPEYRGRGITKRLCVNAVKRIRADHPIGTLFVWPLTAGGERLAASVAKACGLPLRKRLSGAV